MAVHEDLPGVKASICIDGQPIQEFDIDNDEVKHDNHAVKLHLETWTTTKYVESQTDKEFTIKLAMKDPYVMDCPSLVFKVILDGKFVCAVVRFRTDAPLHPSWEFVVRGHELRTTSGTTFKPMRFCKIESTSDEIAMQQVEDDMARLSNVGEILVKVHRQERGVQVPEPYKCESPGMASSKFHEKVLKGEARTHGTSFGATRPAPNSVYWLDGAFLDGEDYPLVTFKFKYRSNEALKALLVIPRTPEPEPAPHDPYPLLTEEQRRTLDVIAKGMVKGRSFKLEGMIKKEEDRDRMVAMRSKRGRNDAKVIDLTDDTDGDPPKRRKVSQGELIDLSAEEEGFPGLSRSGN